MLRLFLNHPIIAAPYVYKLIRLEWWAHCYTIGFNKREAERKIRIADMLQRLGYDF